MKSTRYEAFLERPGIALALPPGLTPQSPGLTPFQDAAKPCAQQKQQHERQAIHSHPAFVLQPLWELKYRFQSKYHVRCIRRNVHRRDPRHSPIAHPATCRSEQTMSNHQQIYLIHEQPKQHQSKRHSSANSQPKRRATAINPKGRRSKYLSIQSQQSSSGSLWQFIRSSRPNPPRGTFLMDMGSWNILARHFILVGMRLCVLGINSLDLIKSRWVLRVWLPLRMPRDLALRITVESRMAPLGFRVRFQRPRASG